MSALARRLYVTAWFALAAVALAYFIHLFQQARDPGSPPLLTSVLSTSPLSQEIPEPSDPSVAQAIARMTSEIESLKSTLEAAQKENAALKAHLRTLEQAYGPSTAALPPEPEKPTKAVKQDPNSGSDEKRSRMNVTMLPLPSTGFPQDIQEAPLPVAQPTEPKRTVFAVELAKGLQAGEVEKRWKDLATKHGALLAKLEPRMVRSGSGDDYALVAGPFKNAAASAFMCARLSLAGLDCSGTVFSGDPLEKVANR